MAYQLDPAGAERRVLHELAEFRGARVLELGCGDGRVTWLYADRAAAVLALDSKAEEIERATRQLPPALRSRVRFEAADVAQAPFAQTAFDIVFFSWSI